MTPKLFKESPEYQLVTIIGSDYFEPIADLLDKLLSLSTQDPNEVKASNREVGYSASVIVLLVLLLESYAMRVRYINRTTIPIKKTPVHQYLKSLYSDFDMTHEVKEVFIVRDVIAHNHLWEIEFTWEDESEMKLLKAEKEASSGDDKYRDHVDVSSRKTTTLGLNVVPVKIGKRDVYEVFQTVWKTLLFLENKDRNQCYVSHLYVKYRGNTVKFGDLLKELSAVV
jgi:hypothetical protein